MTEGDPNPLRPCVVCHGQNDSEFKLCDACRALKQQRRQQKKKQHKCVDCSRTTDGKIRCARCRERVSRIRR